MSTQAGPHIGQRLGERIVHVGQRRVDLVVAEDVESLIDRDALLRHDSPVEPPYWAHLWSGAVELARYVDSDVPCARRRVLDLGCGLGLVGIVASLHGGDVTFLDRDPDALEYAARAAARNGCRGVRFQQADFTCDDLGSTFDLVLGAEVLYDPASWTGLATFIARHLAPAGSAIIADAHRTPTEGFYMALGASRSTWSVERVVVREDGLPVDVDIVTVCAPS
jgi:predicted nicotinamide N-methyase